MRLKQVALVLAGLGMISACEGGKWQNVQSRQTVTIEQPQSSTEPPLGPSQPIDSNTTPVQPDVMAPTPGLAIYWGTGNYQGKDPNFLTVCNTPQYDIIILSFANAIGSKTRNADGYPEMSISGCEGAYNARNPYLPDCSKVGTLVSTCQRMGKKVILSLGGGGAAVGFKDDQEATAYASLMWNLVLGGQGSVRPFGTAVLDGIDLDIEGGSAMGYAAFVNALRALMDADTSKKYLITAAPQCVFPDRWMGPGPGTALTDALGAFDHLYVQFYNNDCQVANAARFDETYKQWSTLSATQQPKIWVGLPGATNAAQVSDFVVPEDLPAMIKKVGARATYGGVMVWDAGYDIIDAAPGAAPYTESIAAAHKAWRASTPASEAR